MTTHATGGQIIIGFGWKGPSSSQGGWSCEGLDIGVVDLVFNNKKAEISVHIPYGISFTTMQKLPFTCRRYQETESGMSSRTIRRLDRASRPNFLKVAVEQIHNLTIKAGIFEESPAKGPVVIDKSGRIVYQERLLRSDRVINLEVPKELEVGQTYTLVVTSDNFSLSARLVKEEKSNSI